MQRIFAGTFWERGLLKTARMRSKACRPHACHWIEMLSFSLATSPEMLSDFLLFPDFRGFL